MNKPYYHQAAGLLALLGVAACMEPINGVAIDNWSVELAAPLLQTSFTLEDALRNTDFAAKINEDEQGALHVGIDEELFDYRIGEAFVVPKLTIPLLDRQTVIDFRSLGASVPVSRIDFEATEVIIQFVNDYTSPATITVESDNFTLEGSPLKVVLRVPARTTRADTFSVNRSRFAVSDEGRVTMSYRADLADGRRDVQLYGGLFSLEAESFTYAEGYLSDLAFDLEAEPLDFTFLDAFEPGTVRLLNPRARLVVENSVGAPVRITANPSSVGLRDGTTVPLTSPLDKGFNLLYPSIAEGNSVKRSELLFDRETSNVETVFNYLPNALHLGVRCQVNADTLKERFFIYRDAVIRGRLEINVPLALQFRKFEIRKAFAIDASSLDAAESASFLLRVENGFGLAANAQVRFLDKDSVEVAQLFPAPVAVLAAASVDASGRVKVPATSDLEIAVSRENLQMISKAVSAEVILTLDSPTGDGANFTQLFYDNSIAVKLGAKVVVKPF